MAVKDGRLFCFCDHVVKLLTKISRKPYPWAIFGYSFAQCANGEVCCAWRHVLLVFVQVPGRVVVKFGQNPGESIVDMAKEEQVAMVVLGCRGLGKIRRTILGSVSDYVLHHVHCPVAVCRHPEPHDGASAWTSHVHTVLAAASDSQHFQISFRFSHRLDCSLLLGYSINQFIFIRYYIRISVI